MKIAILTTIVVYLLATILILGVQPEKMTPTEAVATHLTILDEYYCAILNEQEFYDGEEYVFAVFLYDMPNEYWKLPYDKEAKQFAIVRLNATEVIDAIRYWDEDETPLYSMGEVYNIMCHLCEVFDYDFKFPASYE